MGERARPAVHLVQRQPWLLFVGRTLEEALPTGWTEHLHADDVQAVLESVRDGVLLPGAVPGR